MAVVDRRIFAALLAGLLIGSGVGAQTSTGRISGRVVDSASTQPIGNATVQVYGTQIGGLSRADGGFLITGVSPGSHRVRVTRIGYAARESQVNVNAGETTNLDVSLTPVATQLTAVVTTGYGTQRREAITGSVSTVDADEANKGVLTNPNQLVQGRVAGVNMVTNNGEPGGSLQVTIRGGTSLSASNDPLYVIDGVPITNSSAVADAADIGSINHSLARSPLNSINPSDVESIVVLKDASATAIYGSRGANGVILIQTKRGSSRAGLLQYDGYAAASMPSKKLDYLTGAQYRSYVQSQVTAGKLDQSRLTSLGTANTDWEDAITRTGYAQNHNMAFAGGSQATSYRASLNYFESQGVVISSGLKRYQGRLNGQHSALSGKLNLALNLTASRVNNDFIPFENTGGFEGGLFTNVAIMNPTRPITVTDPTTGQTRFYELGTGAQSVRNPVAMAKQIQDVAPENRVLGNVTSTLTLFPSLTSQTTIGVDYNDAVRRTYFPRTNAVGAAFNGYARQADRNLQNVNFQQLLTFTPKVPGLFGGTRGEFDIVGGYEYSQFSEQGFEVSAQNFITDAFLWNNLGAAVQSSVLPVSYDNDSRLVSFFSRANYGFANKYFLTGVVRYDGSSRLAEGNKWSVFPAVSGSWRMSEESFMQGRPLGISSLAVRGGWGRQGNQAVRPYGTQLLLKADNGARYPFGSGVTTGLVAGQVANPDLKWETTTQTNFGIDYGIKNDKFTGTIDFYQKKTQDLLLDVSVPQPAVVSTRLENVGSIQNRGLEGSIDTRLFQTNNKTLNAGLIATIERGKVLDLGGGRSFIGTGSVSGQGQSGRLAQRIIVGQPLGTFWGPKFLHVNSAGKQVFSCKAGRAECVNGETTSPVGDDEQIIGNANPDFTLGLTSNGRWGKFDASWLWRAEVGKDVFNNTSLVYSTKSNVLQDRNFLKSALSDATALGEPAIYSSRWIESGTFLRLQNITVGYTVNVRPGSGAGRTARLFLSGDNLLLSTKYSGYDPEVFVGAGLASRGIDYVTYPRARTFTGGVQIQF